VYAGFFEDFVLLLGAPAGFFKSTQIVFPSLNDARRQEKIRQGVFFFEIKLS